MRRPGGKFANELAAIATYCTKLVDLELVYDYECRGFMPFLEITGTRLDVLRLIGAHSCTDTETVSRVVQLCPNAKLHLYLRKKAFDMLGVAGKHLCVANIYRYFDAGELSCTNADSLVHLEQFNIRHHNGVSSARCFFENLFASPKLSLRRLYFDYFLLREPDNVKAPVPCVNSNAVPVSL